MYPGFLQHAGFIAMNPSRHFMSHWDFYADLVKGDLDDADSHRKFYDEYNAVLDMPADYYLDTIRTVFQEFSLPRGTWKVKGELVKPAAIKKTEAANQWAFYQAKSTKQSLAEFARDLAPEDKRAAYQGKMDRYEKEKNEIKANAEKLEAEATVWDHSSDEQMHQHHRWAQATTVLQVSIALAAIALLTRKKWLEYGMFALAGVGLMLGALAALHI